MYLVQFYYKFLIKAISGRIPLLRPTIWGDYSAGKVVIDSPHI